MLEKKCGSSVPANVAGEGHAYRKTTPRLQRLPLYARRTRRYRLFLSPSARSRIETFVKSTCVVAYQLSCTPTCAPSQMHVGAVTV